MFLNKKGQSILENIVTVTLVTLGIVMSWDLGTQLIGGGIKNLVSVLEEPDPNKYIRQAPPGGGIVVPGCDCDWFPPLNEPGNCETAATECGDPLKAHHIRTCRPAGCENNIVPPLQMLICDFSNPACCMPWQYTGLCGVNATCSTPGSNSCNSVDSRCNDGTGKYIRNCQGGPEEECRTFSGCDFSCRGTRDQYSTICSNGQDERRLQNNTTSWVIPNNNLCSPNNNPPFYLPKCESTCNPPYVSSGGICQITDPLIVTSESCYCNNPGPTTISTDAACPSGYALLGGWCEFVNNANQPVAGAVRLDSFSSRGPGGALVAPNTWRCRGSWPTGNSLPCTSACPSNLKIRSVAHCWPTARSTPVYPQARAYGACTHRTQTVIGGNSCPGNPWCLCPQGGYAWYSTIYWNHFYPQQNMSSCPANTSRMIAACGFASNISGYGLTMQVRPTLNPNACFPSHLWFSISTPVGYTPAYVVHFCWRNHASMGITNPPACNGSIVNFSAATPACVAPYFPYHSFMTSIGGSLGGTTSTNGDIKMSICCDFTQQVPGNFN